MRNSMVNKFIAITIFSVCMVCSIQAFAEPIVVDPSSDLKKLTITCTDPIEREDGTPLAVGEIDYRRWLMGTAPGEYQNNIAETGQCSLLVDYTDVPDGSYYYVITVVDTDGRESRYSNEYTVVVKRIADPRPATIVGGTRS